MNRLFFALWPDDITRQRCVGIINSMAHESAHPVNAANVHVTLVFLGNVPVSLLEPLISQVEFIKPSGIKIKFNRLSFWKNSGILCLTSSTVGANIVNLVNELSAVAKSLGIKTENRPYRPHITLMRNVKTVSDVDFEPVLWQVNGFCLVKSVAGAYGVEYEIIKEWQVDV